MKRLLHLSYIAIMLLCLLSCNHKQQDNRPIITVSIEPLRYVVEAVAGDKYQVKTLMPQGASPETYEPTPRQMVALGESQLVFRMGSLGFEQTQLPRMMNSLTNVSLIDAAQGVPLIVSTHHHEGELESGDPHVWLSPQNLIAMARNVAETLSQHDKSNAAYYRQRVQRFEQQMKALDQELSKSLQGIKCRTFLIYHPALGYLAHQYGLQQLAVEHDGKEPSAAYMQQLITQCKKESVKVVFISKEHNGRSAERIAHELGAHVVTINPLDFDVPRQLKNIVNELKSEQVEE